MIRKPTLLVVFLLVYWVHGIFSTAFYFSRLPVLASSICAFAILAIVGTYAGWKWVFWPGMVVSVVSFHMSIGLLIGTLMGGGDRLGISTGRIVFGLAVILAFQARSTLKWFRFQDIGRVRWAFWITYGALFLWSAVGVTLALIDAG